LLTWEVQARLLAAESFDSIAAKTGLSPDTIECFHEFFFQVRPFLTNDIYIVTTVFPSKVHSGDLTEEDVDVILMICGYAFGPLYLDRVIRYFREPMPLPTRLSEVKADQLPELIWRLQFRAAVLTQITPANLQNVKRLQTLVGLVKDLSPPKGRAAPCLMEDPSLIRTLLRDCQDGQKKEVLVPADAPELAGAAPDWPPLPDLDSQQMSVVALQRSLGQGERALPGASRATSASSLLDSLPLTVERVAG
jgi:hypothetical protein